MPAPPADGNVTQLLAEWRGGDEAALTRLIPLVYAECVASQAPGSGTKRRTTRCRPRRSCTRRTSGSSGLERMTLRNRAHFFAMAARLMREVLVDHARRRDAQKRGGGVTVLGLDESARRRGDAMVDVLALERR